MLATTKSISQKFLSIITVLFTFFKEMNTTFDFENSWKYDYASYAHNRFLNSLMQNLNNEQSYHTIKNQTVLNKRFDVEKKIID